MRDPRSWLTALAALLLFLGSSIACPPGGEAGIINLPGGRNANSPPRGGPRMQLTRPASANLVFQLSPEMSEAVAFMRSGNSPYTTPLQVVGGRLAISAESLAALASAGVEKFCIEFATADGLYLKVDVEFSPDWRELMIAVW